MSVALPSFSGGGGGSGGASAAKKVNEEAIKLKQKEVDVINDNIKALEHQKDALKDNLKAYKDIIDAQKDKLKAQKEEDEYLNDLKDRNKEITDIDNELLALQFDNSEEASKRRLELEAERAEKAEDIAEFQADRTYDITIDALDKEYDAFEDMINKQIAGVDRMIDSFRTMIDVINDMITALRDSSSQASGGGGASVGAVQGVGNWGNMAGLNWGPWWEQVGQSKGAWSGVSAGASDWINQPGSGYSEGGMGIVPSGHPNDSYPLMAESGELFMIFNKQQQRQLAKGSPISSAAFPSFNTSGAGDGGVKIGDILISVAGNLDKTVLPDLKEMIMKTVNEATRNTGTARNAKSFTV